VTAREGALKGGCRESARPGIIDFCPKTSPFASETSHPPFNSTLVCGPSQLEKYRAQPMSSQTKHLPASALQEQEHLSNNSRHRSTMTLFCPYPFTGCAFVASECAIWIAHVEQHHQEQIALAQLGGFRDHGCLRIDERLRGTIVWTCPFPSRGCWFKTFSSADWTAHVEQHQHQ
jgi:hypothetical protein